MALANFYEIMEAIIGTPTNDYQIFLVFTMSAILGMFIILFVFQLFLMVANLMRIRQK